MAIFSNRFERILRESSQEFIRDTDEPIETPDLQAERQQHPTPEPEAEDLLKDWFTLLCNDVNKLRFIDSDNSHFGDDASKLLFPTLYKSSITGRPSRLFFKDFSVSLTEEEALRLHRMFNKGFKDYYANIFKIQVDKLKYREKERVNIDKEELMARYGPSSNNSYSKRRF